MSDFFKDGSRWGSIDSSGSIYASDGTYLGSLDKFGKFHDSSGTYMGSIDSQGKIRNYKGDYLGSVWSNGEVHNDRGDYIGMFPYYNGKIGQFQIGNKMIRPHLIIIQTITMTTRQREVPQLILPLEAAV